jgi:hypothetical protein
MPSRFSPRFFGSVPKLSGDADRNEDAFKWSSERSALALSDGATESFDSRLWARLLVRLFARKPVLSMAGVDMAIAAFTRCHDPQSMSWSRQAAFDRGSFATLLGVSVSPELDQAHVLAIGDTIALLLDGPRLVTSFPYTDPEEFRRRPTLLSTRRKLNSFLDQPDHTSASTTIWRLDRLARPRIVCMTDAIAEWFLRLAQADPCAGGILLDITDIAHLEALVEHEREAGRMQVDDSTMLILE